MAKAITPWTYSPNSHTEHAEQVRLFMWKQMAVKAGFHAAFYEGAYEMNMEGLAKAYPYNESAQPALDLMFAIPNGGMRDKITAARMKAEGAKRGVADIMLPVPRFQLTVQPPADAVAVPTRHMTGTTHGVFVRGYVGLFIELKRPKAEGQAKGRASDDQSDFAKAVQAQGYAAVVRVGWLAAAYTIANYMTNGTLDET